MIFEVNILHVRPGQNSAFETAFPEAAAILLSVPGCRSARLLRCIERRDRYHIEIGWEHIEDHRDHYPSTEQAARVRALLMPLIGRADLAHFEPVSNA